MGTYVQINTEKLEAFLKACGFSRRVSGSEVVYVMANRHHPDVWVKVYTTIRVGVDEEARSKGQDAIRVTVAYESEIPYRGKTSFGIHKCTRTFRTGSDDAVRDRLYERMREAYGFSNEWLRKNWDGLKRAKRQADADARKFNPRR